MNHTTTNLERILAEAVEIASPTDRQAFVGKACAGNTELRAQVERLMANHFRAGSFLEHPAAVLETAAFAQGEALGTQIGPYKLLEQIGEGGMGIVFVAEQQHPVRRQVAVKLIKPGMDSKQVIARFEAERQALALMDHPNIAKVLDAGETPPAHAGGSRRPYFVMELVRGIPITDYCDQARLSIRQRLEVFVQVCRAVQHAHTKGVIHRDLKPTNVLVTSHDGVPVPLVIDFGVAKALNQQLTERTLHTGFAQMIGTPLYMSPEQAEFNRLGVDTRSDIYSLGVLLYELLTGAAPFDRERLQTAGLDELRRIIREEEPPRPSARLSTLGAALPTASDRRGADPRRLREALHGELDWIVLKSLEKDRTRRYETAGDFAADVQRYLKDEPVEACPPSVAYRLRKFGRRNKMALAAAGLLALAALLLVAGVSWNAFKANEHNKNLREALNRAESSERRLREQNYAIQIKLGSSMMNDDPSGLLGDLLNSLRPAPGAEDSRGFEWYYLWNVASAKLCLRGHATAVNAVALSPDGSLCASGSEEGEIRLWDAGTGASLGKLFGHVMPVRGIAFSLDGRLLASCGTGHSGGDVILWDVGTKNEVARLPRGGPPCIWRVAFPPAGDRIAFCGFDENKERAVVGLWDVKTGRVDYPIREVRTAILEFARSGDQRLLAAARTNPIEIVLSDPFSPEPIRKLHAHKDAVTGLHFLPDDKTLVSGSRDGTIKLWNLKGSDIRKEINLNQPIECLRISPDGRTLAAVTESRQPSTHDTVTLWDLPDAGKRPEELKPDSAIKDLALSGDGRTVAVGCSDHHVLLWRPSIRPVTTLKPAGQKEAWSVAFSPDSQTLAVGYDDEAGLNLGSLKTWDIRTGKETANLHHDAMVTGLAFLPNGHKLASAGYDRKIKIWDTRTRKLLASLNGPSKRIRSLAASPDGRLLASAGWENVVRVWDVAKGLEVLPLTTDAFINRVAFSPDGKTLAAADFEGQVLLWDVTTGQRTRRFRDPVSIFGLAFSPSGRLLATADKDGVVKLHDLDAEEQPTTLLGHKGQALAVAFSADGKTIATGGDDRTVRLWHTSTGRELLVFADLPQKVNSLTFSPDGRHLAAALHDGSVLVWSTVE